MSDNVLAVLLIAGELISGIFAAYACELHRSKKLRIAGLVVAVGALGFNSWILIDTIPQLRQQPLAANGVVSIFIIALCDLLLICRLISRLRAANVSA